MGKCEICTRSGLSLMSVSVRSTIVLRDVRSRANVVPSIRTLATQVDVSS
jgi:hypothetical protein